MLARERGSERVRDWEQVLRKKRVSARERQTGRYIYNVGSLTEVKNSMQRVRKWEKERGNRDTRTKATDVMHRERKWKSERDRNTLWVKL